MEDKGLLELAAKAAGYELTYEPGYLTHFRTDIQGRPIWNPLTDDGDALRLAVNLGMMMFIWQPNDGIGTHYTEINRGVKAKHNDDPYAATRRAIVCAAAEIGRKQE